MIGDIFLIKLLYNVSHSFGVSDGSFERTQAAGKRLNEELTKFQNGEPNDLANALQEFEEAREEHLKNSQTFAYYAIQLA